MFRLLKDFLVYGVASVIAKIIGVFLMPVYTNVLSREQYGAVAMITACVGLLDLFSNLNIHSGMAREYNEVAPGGARRRLVTTGFYSELGSSVAVMAVMMLTGRFWTDTVLGIPAYYVAFMVMLLTVPCQSVITYFSLITRYKHRASSYALGATAQLLIQVGVSVYAVVVAEAGVTGVFVGMLAGQLFAVAYFMWINRELLGGRLDTAALRRMLLFALPTLPAVLAAWVDSSVGQLVVGRFVSVAELGVYSVALQFASVFGLLGVAFQNIWSPFLYENYRNVDFPWQAGNIYTVLASTSAALTLVVGLMSPEVIRLLSTPAYAGAAQFVPWLCVAMALYVFFPLASSGIWVSRATGRMSVAYIVGGGINLGLLFGLVPHFGAGAAPFALCLARGTELWLLTKESRRTLVIPFPRRSLACLIGAAFVGWLLTLGPSPLPLRLCLSTLGVLYLLYLHRSRLVSLRMRLSAH